MRVAIGVIPQICMPARDKIVIQIGTSTEHGWKSIHPLSRNIDSKFL